MTKSPKRTRVLAIVIGLLVASIIVSLSVLILLKPAKTTTQPYSAGQSTQSNARKLVFSDEFNESTLDASKWNTCYDSYSSEYQGCTNYGNFEDEWYTQSQVGLSDGNLVLTAQKRTTKGLARNDQGYTYEHDYAYNSGMVATGGYMSSTPAKWGRTYGYYEARMNVPSGQGIWPAFWLLPVDHTWPPEIDILELLGNKPDQALLTYHWRGADNTGQPKDSTTYTSPSSLANSWHVYAVDWQPNKIDWYIDGKVVKHVEGMTVPSQDMQVIFDLAVGGTLPGQPDATTPEQSKMLIDYIRVYQ